MQFQFQFPLIKKRIRKKNINNIIKNAINCREENTAHNAHIKTSRKIINNNEKK